MLLAVAVGASKVARYKQDAVRPVRHRPGIRVQLGKTCSNEQGSAAWPVSLMHNSDQQRLLLERVPLDTSPR